MLEDLKLELQALEAEGRLKDLAPRIAKVGSEISYRNHKLVDFTSWDLLNLSNSLALKRSFQSEAELSGVSSCANRLSSGTLPAHLSLEIRIAKFLGTEAAALFSSTNQAILSLLSALISERDCVLVDSAEHHSIIDAAHLVGAELLRFSLKDLDTLVSALDKAKGYRRKVLFVEGLSPVTGVVPNLDQIIELCEKRETAVIVDESFALGMVGLRGAGCTETGKLQKKPLAIVAGMGGALCAYGAFVSGSKILIQYLENRSRTFAFENSLPAPICAVAEKSIDIIELEIAARERVKNLSSRLRLGMISMGIMLSADATTASSSSPVISLKIDRARTARELVSALFQRGILCESLNEVAILDQGSLVRFIVTAAHSENDIEKLLSALAEVYRRIE